MKKEEWEKNWKVSFWNMVIIQQKDRRFWEGLWKAERLMVLSKTWLVEKGWKAVKGRLPKDTYGR